MVICITGMHRSGTSLAASWLESCGLTIHDGAVWGPSVGNVKGHFEDKDFVKLHSDAIRLKSPESNGWKIFTPAGLPFNSEYTALAQKLIERRNTRYEIWGWKDPRTVLFLDQWKTLIPGMKVVLVWRPCIEVVHSLVTRSHQAKQKHYKITLLTAVKLWHCYNERIYSYKQQQPDDTVLVSLNTVIQNDAAVFKLLNERFGVNLHYTPINKHYTSSLLHRKTTSLSARLVSWYYKSAHIEERLRNLSDVWS